jgi:membrane associated rhomboid family serine protease
VFLPVGHDQSVRRFPYVTLAIMAICVLVQIASCVVAPSANDRYEALSRVEKVEKRILTAYYASGTPVHAAPLHVDEGWDEAPTPAPSASTAPPAAVDFEKDPHRVLKEFRDGKIGAPDDPLRKELADAENVALALDRRDLVQRFGHRPSDGVGANFVLSTFVHAGWLHLVGNMIFLWLCGMNMEDRWGHVGFGVFYVLAGVVATATWTIVHAGSSVPCVGASGAIAGTMGAFLVGYHDARLKILWWPPWRFSLTPQSFHVRALFAMPIWFLGQLFDALFESGKGGGVGYSAHVGGFVFGFAVAFGLRASKLEARIVPAHDDDASEGAAEEAEIAKARETAMHDPSAAIAALRTALVKHPDRIRARRVLLELALDRADASAIATSASAVLAHLGENGEWAELVRTYLALEQRAPKTPLTDRALAMATRAAMRTDDAAVALRAARRLVDVFPTSALLRGTLWDLEAVQARAGTPVFSPETLRRVTSAPPDEATSAFDVR